jgi:site-specific DNA-methyltransferase (adenine-specific)
LGETVARTDTITAPSTPEAQQWAGWGTALKPAHEPIVLARKPLIGTVAANVLEHGTGGLNIDGSRVGSEGGTRGSETSTDTQSVNAYSNGLNGGFGIPVEGLGRFPANIIHDGSDEVLAGFPTSTSQKGTFTITKSGNNTWDRADKGMFDSGRSSTFEGYGDSGTAARFFYCAKASKRDRNEGLDGFEQKQSAGGGGGIGDYQDDVNSASGKFGSEKASAANHHPTVKPTDLMRYLVKLITPPNGIVLDPFTGSGSTGKGAVIEGFTFIGIELDPDYVAIATARIQHQIDTKPETEPTLFNQTN